MIRKTTMNPEKIDYWVPTNWSKLWQENTLVCSERWVARMGELQFSPNSVSSNIWSIYPSYLEGITTFVVWLWPVWTIMCMSSLYSSIYIFSFIFTPGTDLDILFYISHSAGDSRVILGKALTSASPVWTVQPSHPSTHPTNQITQINTINICTLLLLPSTFQVVRYLGNQP